MAKFSAVSPADQAGSNKIFAIAILGLLVVAAGVVSFLATDRGEEASAAADSSIGEVVIEGDVIDPMADGAADEEIGKTAPDLTGTSFDGSEVSITADGRPKVVYFVAHWCPHCQEEVPLIQELIDGGSQPDGLDIYAVSTSVDGSGDNFPPSRWLEGEGFEPLTLRDDEQGSAFTAFGGSGFPYAVYLDGDNTILNRTAGQVPAEETISLWETTAASAA